MPSSNQGVPPVTAQCLRCKEHSLKLHERTHLMGILNITPDSFSDGGDFLEATEAASHALKMVRDGADIIDVGAESSRPGAKALSTEEELNRLLPVLRLLVKELPVPISVDTYKAEVAQAALDLGVQIINDISGLTFDAQMAPVIAGYDAALIIMHMQGNPGNMQDNPHYEALIPEIGSFLQKQINFAIEQGIAPDSIVIDPGIGFGKNLEHNLQIIKYMDKLKELGKPILLGSSRKSFIGKILDLPVQQREYGTAATVTYGILHGAQIVRVHDVAAMGQVVRMTDAIRRAN